MTIIKNILLGIALMGIVALTSCGKKDTPAPQVDPTQAIIDGLSKTWNVNTVTLDNAAVTGDWTGFELQFSGSQGYTATNLSVESVLVWPVSGSYTFPNANNPNVVERNDGVQITISNLSTTTATLTFNIAGRNGRTEGLIGKWVFEMEN